jgi:hypothetical protein
MYPSARQAALTMAERAAFNDAAVKASGAGSPSAGIGGMDPGARARYEGEKAVARKRKLAEAGITPEMEKQLLGDMEATGGRSFWAGSYGPGFQEYRSRAALDALAMERTRSGGNPNAQIDASRWSLPAGYTL